MSRIHFNQTTTLTPEQYVAGLTDFGPGRSKVFGNSADDYLKVHSKDVREADVTEGSRGIWERLRYDRSDPNRVVLTTTDFNTWGLRNLEIHNPIKKWGLKSKVFKDGTWGGEIRNEFKSQSGEIVAQLCC
jgi:hypothetical protein